MTRRGGYLTLYRERARLRGGEVGWLASSRFARGSAVWIALVSFCVLAALAILGVAVLRWWRNPEFLRWIRIEKRARTREAAQRAAARYASLPSITVMPPLEPSAPPASLASNNESIA